MKLINPKAAGQKFITSEGTIEADRNGMINIPKEMSCAFLNSGWEIPGQENPTIDNGRVVKPILTETETKVEEEVEEEIEEEIEEEVEEVEADEEYELGEEEDLEDLEEPEPEPEPEPEVKPSRKKAKKTQRSNNKAKWQRSNK